jgi:hypothetical protein
MNFTNQEHLDILKLVVSNHIGESVHLGIPDDASSWEDCDFVSHEGNEKPAWADIEPLINSRINSEDLQPLRNERSRLLAESDWTQSEDIAQSTRDAWKPYRQALRDITDTYTSLEDVVWPDKPE